MLKKFDVMEKWKPVLFANIGPELKTEYQRMLCAVLLECQFQYNTNHKSYPNTNMGYAMPIIRRIVPAICFEGFDFTNEHIEFLNSYSVSNVNFKRIPFAIDVLAKDNSNLDSIMEDIRTNIECHLIIILANGGNDLINILNPGPLLDFSKLNLSNKNNMLLLNVK